MVNDRRKFIQNSLLGTSGLLLSSYLLTSCSKKVSYDMLNNIPETALYKMKHLRGNVGYFSEKGGTIGWITSGKNAGIIDTQFPDQVKNLLSEMKKITDEKIEMVFNTHHHSDHTAGNIVLKDLCKKFIAHENSFINQRNAATAKGELDKIHLPNITFKEEYKTKLGSENIKAYYFGAAHTNGDAIIHMEESNVAHIGDLVFNRRFPYIDKGAGANIKNWALALDKVKSTFDNDTIMLCGHAGQDYDVVINKNDISAFQNYLIKLLELGEKCKKEGMDLEKAKATYTMVPGAEEWKGDGIARSLDALFAEMNGM